MKTYKQFLTEEKDFSKEDAQAIGAKLGIDFSKIDLEQFRLGLGVETEHDSDPKTDVVDGIDTLAKIVLAHLDEDPAYYTKLMKAGL